MRYKSAFEAHRHHHRVLTEAAMRGGAPVRLLLRKLRLAVVARVQAEQRRRSASEDARGAEFADAQQIAGDSRAPAEQPERLSSWLGAPEPVGVSARVV
jgi:hypothetical protein